MFVSKYNTSMRLLSCISYTFIFTVRTYVRSYQAPTGDAQNVLRLIINYNNLPDDGIWAVWDTLDKIQFSQLLKLSFIVSKSYIFSLHKRRILEFCNGMMFLMWSEVNMNCNDISKSTYFQKRSNRSSVRIHIQKSIFSKHWLLDQFSFSISFLRIFCNPWLRKIILTSLWFIFSFSLQ